MAQNLEELRGPDLATLLEIREKSMREATGTENPFQYPEKLHKTVTFRPFSKSKKPTPHDDARGMPESEEKAPQGRHCGIS